MTTAGDWLGLAGKRVVVTGAAGGIGYGIAECFVGQGASVYILDQDEGACLQAVEKLGGRARQVFGQACDVSSPEQVRAAAARMLDLTGPCDVLVNNAAVQRTGPLATLKLEDWRKVLDVNLSGALLCSQAFGRHMLDRNSGSIVHIASIAARFPQPSGGAYGAGKAGLLMLSQGLALEWGPSGVRSNCVSPGATGAGMASRMVAGDGVAAARKAIIPLGRVGMPDDIGDVVLFLASDRARYITGENIQVDGGYGLTALDLLPRPGKVTRQTAS